MKKTILVLIWLSLACFSSGTQIQGADKIYPIKKVTPAAKEKNYAQEKKIFRSFVSEKNLLELKRKTPFGLPEISSEPAQLKTIRILAIRVEFEYENPDDPTTTGRGRMDLRPYDQFVLEEGHQIDPSPHNVAYFYMHLEALRIFWETASNDKLTLQFDVYPLDFDSSYKLNHPIAYYGFKPPLEGLTEFFKDSWSTADTVDSFIDFSQYDAFIIFHAGSDRQSDFSFSPTPTPHDLFSAFIMLETPVVVDSGNFAIKEGLFLPETVSQDGIVRALNSVLAHEFGHQLGLPDLYNTATFTTQIGDFSLMDNNGADVAVDLGFISPAHGTLPIFPDAWCKAFLGFTQPVEILNQTNIKLIATEMLRSGIQTVKIPINSQEYFLLENRQLDLDKDGRTDLKADPSTGVILGPGKCPGNCPPDTGIFTREYDALSPGSGVLIWHVDEGVAYLNYDDSCSTNNFACNTLQWDKNRRFISLVEADGIVDFGGDYYTGFGSQEDMYYFGNNTALTPTTFPSSRSNTKANSHIYITKISRSDTVMTLDIANDFVQPGWPQRYKFSDKKSALVFADVDSLPDNRPEIFMASGKYLLGWRGDGSKFISNNDMDTVIQLNGDTIFYPLAVFAQIDTPFVGPPSIGDLNSDDTLELCIGAEDGNVYVYSFSDNDLDGRADLKQGAPLIIPGGTKISWSGAIAKFDSLSGKLGFLVGYQNGYRGLVEVNSFGSLIIKRIDPVIAGKVMGVAASDSSGIYYILIQQDSLWSLRSSDGKWNKTFISSQVYPPVVVDLDQDTAFLNQDTTFLDVILATKEGNVYAWNQFGQLMTGFPAQLSEVISSAPVVGNIDNDNFKEIIFSGDNKIWALNYNGTLASNFPITIDVVNPVGEVPSTAVLGDLNADKITDILVGSPQKEVVAYHSSGEKVAGFPLSVGSEVKLSCAILNLEPISGPVDSSKQIAAISEDGFVYMWQVGGNFSDTTNPWPMEGLNPQHTRLIPLSIPTPPPLAIQLVPPGQFYNYPNPAEKQTTIRYYLTQPATVNLKFYDLSGNLVHHVSQAGLANTDNELVWDCSDIASGVYLCRLEAFNSNLRQVSFTKIAIVK